MAREFYRILRSERPTLDDFKSARELGKPPVRRYLREWAESISVHDDLDHSKAHARDNRLRLGRSVVRLIVPEDGTVEFAQTTRDPHHFSIYASAEVILSFVAGEIIPVEEQ